MIHDPNPYLSAAEVVAPARINLLGEHTDYTGGFVMPMAIPFTTVAAVAPSPDSADHISSEMFNESLDFARNDRSEARQSWTDYPVGVLRELQSLGIDPPPFCLSLASAGRGISNATKRNPIPF